MIQMPVYKWQYNGVAKMVDIIEWCWATLTYGTWNYRYLETIEFYDEASYTLFLVRWS